MSSQPNSNLSTVAIVIAVCVAIGFGAVYAMVGGGDNRVRREVRELKSVPVLGLPGAAATTAASKASGSAPAGTRLTGADGKPLNRGAMTTFVFKAQPTPIEKQPEFNRADGKRLTLADFKGKVILLNLWATWCAPCRKEMPHLDQLQKELGSDQFEVVALSVDRGSPEKSKAFLAEVGVSSLKFYHDPAAKAGFALMAIGMPTTLLFDREGREIGRLVGPAEWHSQEAKDLIRAVIAAG